MTLGFSRRKPFDVIVQGTVTSPQIISFVFFFHDLYDRATTESMAISDHVKRGHTITLGLLIIFSIIELAISAWLVSMFNRHHSQLSGAVNDRTRYLLFTSIWTVTGSSILMALFLLFSNISTSVGVHLVYLTLTWIFWTAGAAAITAALGGGLDCNLDYTYCGQLNALEGFAWLSWILTTFAVVVVIFRSISSHKRGDSWHGQLV